MEQKGSLFANQTPVQGTPSNFAPQSHINTHVRHACLESQTFTFIGHICTLSDGKKGTVCLVLWIKSFQMKIAVTSEPEDNI